MGVHKCYAGRIFACRQRGPERYNADVPGSVAITVGHHGCAAQAAKAAGCGGMLVVPCQNPLFALRRTNYSLRAIAEWSWGRPSGGRCAPPRRAHSVLGVCGVVIISSGHDAAGKFADFLRAEFFRSRSDACLQGSRQGWRRLVAEWAKNPRDKPQAHRGGHVTAT